MRGAVENILYVQEYNWLCQPERLLVASVPDPSIYDHVRRVLGHPGEEGMQWHREHTTSAAERCRTMQPDLMQSKRGWHNAADVY
jgi:hypothetical protein